ncbi:hypothetical protein LTR95_000047 [Oleoguttula sp. CCFEE 5521]
MASSAAPPTNPSTPPSKPPVAIVCVGMAGSGKTTFTHRLVSHLHNRAAAASPPTAPPYVLNLDPAVRSVPFESNIDIRDSVNYKEVMKQYNLGPNGGILTSLNLFATKVDQVMGILEKRCLPQPAAPSTTAPAPTSTPDPASQTPEHIILDTPGQIEVFVWSASGSILLSALSTSFPTVLAYIIDTPRTTQNTATFMSNMLYAISILYKTRLPMILVFNKTDVKDETEAVGWMRDFETFQAAVREEEEGEREGGIGGGGGYMGGLLNSMSLVLEEFYAHLSVVGVSAATGDGIEEFLEAVEGKREEFDKEFRPGMDDRKAELKKEREQADLGRMMGDLGVSSKAKGTGKYSKRPAPKHEVEEAETVSEAEELEEERRREREDGDGWVERDEDEPVGGEDDEDEGGKEGLQARYAQALGKSGGAADMASEYIRRTQG